MHSNVINLPVIGIRISIGSLLYSIPSTVYAQNISPLCCTVVLIVCPTSTPFKHPVEHLHLNSVLATGVDVIEHVKLSCDPIKYAKLLLSPP